MEAIGRRSHLLRDWLAFVETNPVVLTPPFVKRTPVRADLAGDACVRCSGMTCGSCRPKTYLAFRRRKPARSLEDGRHLQETVERLTAVGTTVLAHLRLLKHRQFGHDQIAPEPPSARQVRHISLGDFIAGGSEMVCGGADPFGSVSMSAGMRASRHP